MPRVAYALLLGLIVLVPACTSVRRTITVTSEPAGALLWLNGREIGRTPVTVDFLYYGDYDVVLALDGYEPLLTFGRASPPWWDQIPLDLAAELAPLRENQKHAQIHWHYVLAPPNDERQGLLERAASLRRRIAPPADAAVAEPVAPSLTP